MSNFCSLELYFTGVEAQNRMFVEDSHILYVIFGHNVTKQSLFLQPF